ncbi:hypothetical protein EPUL_000705 [Erysiphe pulchra]|uniref:Uncharacterized protein n=1 Tax=Erysiphe pulchra TaxID=225359 RepID=A0A2S4PTJ4_9PEZI|nr:hypothetical protein EPUL_000705 [Erysiphe pulchra]
MGTPDSSPLTDCREKTIYEDLVHLRDELTVLKQDRSTYIKFPDVIAFYNRTVMLAELINDTRMIKSNQVDQVLDSCFKLLSLFFMTAGRNNEAPAVYALLSTIKRLLNHLIEADLYSNKDLVHISVTLDRLREVVKKAHGSYSEKLTTLLTSRIDFCQSCLTKLRVRLAQIHEDLHPIYENLICISRLISSANTRTNFSILEIQKLKNQLVKIDHQRLEGNFVHTNGQIIKGSHELGELLDYCFAWSDMALKQEGKMPEPFIDTYKTLLGIRNKLANISLTQAWSLREADLYDFQKELEEIDESRVNGKFLDVNGNPAESYVQRTFLYLIRRSYSYIYYLMIASEPVSEELLPVFNQLQTLKRCLIEVKNLGGVSSVRELYPYSMKLNSIDSMRVDGKFHVGNDVPEGQGSVTELLEQCYELSYQLQVDIDGDSDETS